MATTRDPSNRAKSSVREVQGDELEARLGEVVLLDVREPDEYEQGALPGAVHIPRGYLELQVEGRLPDKSAHVVVYCAGGVRSAFAAKTMGELGYTDVRRSPAGSTAGRTRAAPGRPRGP